MKSLLMLALLVLSVTCHAGISLRASDSQHVIIVSAGKAVIKIHPINPGETPQIDDSITKKIGQSELMMFDAWIGGNCGNRLYVAKYNGKTLTASKVGDECGSWDYIDNGVIGYRGYEFSGICGMDNSYVNWPPYPVVVMLDAKNKPYYKIADVNKYLDNSDVLDAFQTFISYVVKHEDLQKIKNKNEEMFCKNLAGRTDYKNVYHDFQKFRNNL